MADSMSKITKRIGPVSAYAVAVENGYTGTEAEWEAYIAAASTNAAAAAESAASALLSKEDALAAKDAAQAAAATAAAAYGTDLLADDFSTEKGYAAGDYVIYSGSLYRFTVDHAAGSWTGTDATAVPVGGEIAKINDELAANGIATLITDGWITGKRMGTPEIGSTISDSPGSISSWRYIKIPCSPGDVFTINAVGTTTFRTWFFADASLICLARNTLVNNASVSVNEVITAPDTAAWLYINQNADRGDCFAGDLIGHMFESYATKGYADAAAIAEADTCLRLYGNKCPALLGTAEEPLSLNEVINSGTYRITARPSTVYVTDYPLDRAAKLIVGKTTSNPFTYQIYLTLNNQVFIRYTPDAGETWTEYKQIAFTSDIVEAIGEQKRGDALAVRKMMPPYYTAESFYATQKPFSVRKAYKAGDRVLYSADTNEEYGPWGIQYVFTADHFGAWTGNDVRRETFDPAESYVVGDKVVYGDLETPGYPMLPYVFINAHTGAWDAADVSMIGDYSDIAYIDKVAEAVPSGKSFCFITDTHWESNAKNSPLLLNYVRNRLGVETCVFGGDFIDGEINKYTANQVMQDFAGQMYSVFGDKFYTAIGNHDQNLANYESRYSPTAAMMEDRFLPYKAVYDCLFAPYASKANTFWDAPYWTYSTENGATEWMANNTTNGARIKQIADDASLNTELEAYGRMTYYIDDEALKTRFISFMCLAKPNYGAWFDVFDSETVRMYIGWLYHVLLETPKGFSVVFVTHQGANSLSERTYGSSNTSVITHLLMGLKLKANKRTLMATPKINEARFMSGLDSFDDGEDFNRWRQIYCNFTEAQNVGPVFILLGHAHVDDILVANQSASEFSQVDVTIYDGTSRLDQTVDSTAGGGNYNGCPIPMIHLTTDAYGRFADGYYSGNKTWDQLTIMEKDSVKEQAFDIVTVTSGGVRFTRVGAGNNRSVRIKY